MLQIDGTYDGRYAIATAWLWVDGRCIYHVRDLGGRVPAAERC
jgi:hypothetical protein